MAKSKCLDNLRRKRRVQLRERVKNHFASERPEKIKPPVQGYAGAESRNSENRPSSITKARGGTYSTPVYRFKNVVGSRLTPGEGNRYPRKFKKELKKTIEFQYEKVIY